MAKQLINSKNDETEKYYKLGSKTTLNFYDNNKAISKWDEIQNEFGRRQNEAAREDQESRMKKCLDQNSYNTNMSKNK